MAMSHSYTKFSERANVFLPGYGIWPVFYESEYEQYWQDAMFPNPELAE